MKESKKEKLEDAIWNRIEKLMVEKNMKQSQLVNQCKVVGMPITQPELSKLHNRVKKINIYELTAIAKALDVPVDFFVSDYVPYREEFMCDRSNKLLSKAENEAFGTYFGDYYIYFNTTTEQEDKVQGGKMSIFKEKAGYCKVELLINTGAYRDTKEIVKKYEGRMFITTRLSGAYIVLKNDAIGELCFMTMRHRAFTVKQLECRLALCLTIGAGENKLPTVHRMLISRRKLSDEQVEAIRPYFDLSGNLIRIEKSKAIGLVENLNSEEEKAALEMLWKILPEKQYYELSIELLRRHLHLDREKFAVFIADILRTAETEPYSKIRENDDNLTYAILAQQDVIRNGMPPDE